jgi:predicted transcriptional regulator
MNNNPPNYAEIPVCPETLQTMPESSSPWHVPNPEREATRAEVVDEMMALVETIVLVALTPRQREIFRLRFQEKHTQAEIAEMLGISQATVNHHLVGKMRGDSCVGGVIQKIRKRIRKEAGRGMTTSSRRTELFLMLNKMLGQSTSRRGLAASLLESGITLQQSDI